MSMTEEVAMPALRQTDAGRPQARIESKLDGKTVAMIVFSGFPNDPRPRRCAEALASSGMSVDVVCEDGGPDHPRVEERDGITVLRLPLKHQRGHAIGYLSRYAGFILLSTLVTAWRWRWRRYDLVYIHNMPDVLVAAGVIPKLLGARVILDLHDPMPELMMTIFGLTEASRPVWLLKVLEKWSIRIADRVITVNRACAKMFSARSCPPDKVAVVMNSPDEAIFGAPVSSYGQARNADRPFVVMYHGSLVKRNGLALAVEALAAIRSSIPQLEFRVYGRHTGAFLDGVLDTVRSQGLEDIVRYMGPRTLEEIASEIELCDVGIIPNERSIFTEINTPTRIFEYLARGKPVIAPRAPGICDYFDEESLVFFELGDAEDLARKILYVASEPAETAEVLRRGMAIQTAHSWVSERRKLIHTVADLLDGSRRSV